MRALALPLARSGCTCGLRPCLGWESISEFDWPATQMQPVATLRDSEIHEPSFDEYHPAGTRYDSTDAPIALAHFPYNRSDVYRCTHCLQLWLRYTEYGGYYIDHRVRRLSPALVEDATL